MRSLLALFLMTTAAHALTVDDAINLALSKQKGNVHQRAQREQAAAAHDTAKSARSRQLFTLHASEEWQYFDCPYAISFTTLTAACQNDLPASDTPPLIEREQKTNTFVISATQPLLGLLRLHAATNAEEANAASVDESVNADEAKLVEGIRNGFLKYFEAVAAEGVASDSEKELTDQLGVAKSREAAGTITVADRLRVQVALANAHQQKVQAHAQAEIARMNVLDTVGLSVEDDSIQLEEPTKLLADAATAAPERGAATNDAIARRPELRQAKLQLDAADAAHKAQQFAMLPDVDLEAAYTRIDGQILSPKNSYFVGVRAQWTFWTAGADYYQQRAAEHKKHAAELAFEDSRRHVTVEVRTAYANLDAATSAVTAATEAIDSANEAYRVMTKLVEAGNATTTDLLSAEAELTTARLNLSRSKYEQAIARVTLRRLTGD
ncbi:MAG: TolC family protein [Kofleriaceae bacterium]